MALNPRLSSAGVSFPVPHLIEDRHLLQMAAEPARPLFPLWRHAGALSPLLVFVPFVLGLYAVHHRTQTELGAWWGLRGLAVSTAQEMNEFVDSHSVDPQNPLRFQPPLMSWMLAAGFRVLSPAWSVSQWWGGWVATIVMLWMVTKFLRRAFDERLSVLAGLALAVHAPVLAMAQQQVPQALGMWAALLAFWGFQAHAHAVRATASGMLLLAGVGLGLCLLAVGPVAIVVWLILAAWIIVVQVRGWWGVHEPVSSMSFMPRWGWRIWRSWGLLGLTAFAVGGWWELMMGSYYGRDFWWSWMNGPEWAVVRAQAETLLERRVVDLDMTRPEMVVWDAASMRRSFVELLHLICPFATFALAGAWCLLKGWLGAGEPRVDGRDRVLLLVWGCVAVAVWVPLRGPWIQFHVPDAWSAFCLLPCVCLASFAGLEIIERRIPFRVGMMLAGCAILEVLWVFGYSARHLVTESEAAWFGIEEAGSQEPGSVFSGKTGLKFWIASVTLLYVVGRVFDRWSVESDARRRLALSRTLLGLFACVVADGVLGVRQATPSDREWALFRKELRQQSLPRSRTRTETHSSPGTHPDPAMVAARLSSHSPSEPVLQQVTRCTLVSLQPLSAVTASRGTVPVVPPELILLVRSLFPQAEVAQVNGWEAAFISHEPPPHLAKPGAREAELRQHVIVTWAPQSLSRIPPTVRTPQRLTGGCLYRGYEIHAYLDGPLPVMVRELSEYQGMIDE